MKNKELRRKVIINKTTKQWSITLPKKELLKLKKKNPKFITLNPSEITW